MYGTSSHEVSRNAVGPGTSAVDGSGTEHQTDGQTLVSARTEYRSKGAQSADNPTLAALPCCHSVDVPLLEANSHHGQSDTIVFQQPVEH